MYTSSASSSTRSGAGIRARGDFTLEEGMVFNYETPYAQIGFGGMQLEDTFLVTKDGAVDLSPMNRELVSI